MTPTVTDQRYWNNTLQYVASAGVRRSKRASLFRITTPPHRPMRSCQSTSSPIPERRNGALTCKPQVFLLSLRTQLTRNGPHGHPTSGTPAFPALYDEARLRRVRTEEGVIETVDFGTEADTNDRSPDTSLPRLRHDGACHP